MNRPNPSGFILFYLVDLSEKRDLWYCILISLFHRCFLSYNIFILKKIMGTRFILNENDRNDIRKMYGLFSEQLTGGTVNQQTNRPNNIPQTGGTTNRQANIPQSGNTKSISNRNPNRPTCDGKGLISLGCWLDEIDRVQREIGNPSTWTMDSYNRLQKTLNDYKTWRTTTPEGQAVQDSHNEKNEYVVQLPPHLQNLNESYLTRLVKGIVKEDLYENYRHRKSTK